MLARPAVLVPALAFLLGCAPHIERLYPHPEMPRPTSEVASIMGPIAFIDGRSVSPRGTVFHVLPGCHVIQLLESLGERNTTGTSGWVVHLPPYTYVFNARPMFSYEIQPDARFGSTSQGRVYILAYERAPDGTARPLRPTKDPNAFRTCLASTSQPG